MLAAGAASALLVTAGPASAHVEVSADKAVAGAQDAALTFVAESESTTAGITALRVVLPAGIAPADVAWVSGPPGWTLKAAGDGYTVSGPAVPAGRDATYAVRIRQLPTDARQLVFKTLQTYSDGRVDRWIEEPQAGAVPENPAPVLTLAAAPAPSGAASTPAPPTAASSPTDVAPSATGTATVPVERDGGTPAWVWLAVAAAVAVAAGGVWWVRRRRT